MSNAYYGVIHFNEAVHGLSEGNAFYLILRDI